MLDAEESPEIDLYAFLDLEKTATSIQIKKQYRLLALKYHPDKNNGEGGEHFHGINRAYKILSNPEKRKMYDETGYIDEDMDPEAENKFMTAYVFYRQQFKKVEEVDIQNFQASYKNSERELEDLLQYYLDFKGDMKNVLEWVPLSTNEDIPRFVQGLEELIQNGNLSVYPKFNQTKKNIKRLTVNEENEAEEMKSGMEELKNQIMLKRNNGNQNFAGYLAEKYGDGKENEEGEVDVDEEEFLRIRANLMKGKKDESKKAPRAKKPIKKVKKVQK